MSRSPKMRKRSFLSRVLAGLVLALPVACHLPTAPDPNAPATRTEVSQNGLDLAGTYTLTLSASSQCGAELPPLMRTRTYAAAITQAGGSLVVKLPAIFPPWDNKSFGLDNRFTGVFGGNNDVIFQMQFEEWFAEEIGDFAAYGRITAAISPSGLSGLWDGYMRGIVTNEDGRGTRAVTCTASDHGVTFSR